MPGRQGLEKIHPAINFTLHSKVRAVASCYFRSLGAEDGESSFLFSIYRVAFGYLPNPRCRHLKFSLRLPYKRPLPPRWRRPRLSKVFTHPRAGVS